jgi:hypothetical protein
MALRDDVPIARVELGSGAGMAVSIYAFTTEDMGIPLVEVVDHRDCLQHLKPETAEKLAEGLLLAARVARGEPRPDALATFLDARRRP